MFLTLCLNDSKVEVTHRFYERLGYNFAPEQHGEKGLAHYSTVVPSMPVEIYPAVKGLPSEDHFWIGITVDAPESVKAELIQEFGGSEPQPSIPMTKSGIATLRDPNGILIRLFPKL